MKILPQILVHIIFFKLNSEGFKFYSVPLFKTYFEFSKIIFQLPQRRFDKSNI